MEGERKGGREVRMEVWKVTSNMFRRGNAGSEIDTI
jgi:hypothetical protein